MTDVLQGLKVEHRIMPDEPPKCTKGKIGWFFMVLVDFIDDIYILVGTRDLQTL